MTFFTAITSTHIGCLTARLEQVDHRHSVDVGPVQHVFRVQPGDSGVGAGGEQKAVQMRQAETLVEFQGVVGGNGSRLRIAVGLNDMLPRSPAIAHSRMTIRRPNEPKLGLPSWFCDNQLRRSRQAMYRHDVSQIPRTDETSRGHARS